MLKERSQKHIETKTDIIRKEYIKNEEEPEMLRQNAISAEEQIEESKTQIDYEERITQVIVDKINDAISQTARKLEYIRINQNKIDEIYDKLHEKEKELFKYSGKISEALIDLDEEISTYVQNINMKYVNKMLNQKDNTNESKERSSVRSKFIDSLEVNNSQSQIEKKAVENITKGSKNNQKEHFKDGLNPDEIFNVGEKKSTDKSESEGLDASDIF